MNTLLEKLTLMRISLKPITKVSHFPSAHLYLNVIFLTYIFLTNSNPSDWSIEIPDTLSDVTYELTSTTPSIHNYTDSPSKQQSLTKTNDTPLSKQIIKTRQHNPPIGRSCHQSQNQSTVPSPPIERTTKIRYNLRRRPKIDYRLFIPPSRLLNQSFVTFTTMKTSQKKHELSFH